MLYIVATPIGNLKDITLRSLDILQSVDEIICEDTRRTALLLNHYQIKKPMLVINDFNETRSIPQIIQKLLAGENLALVSDAGTPLISDPGYKLIRECITAGVQVDSLPGPSSVITALTLSGLPPDKFLFLGYPPDKPGQRINWLQNLKSLSNEKINFTNIMFVAPHKLIKTLQDLQTVFGDINVVLAKELTKIHQSIANIKISQWLTDLSPSGSVPKGEYILLFNLRTSS